MTVIEKIRARGRVPRAALYARFSSDNQREESIEAQLRAMQDFCQRNSIAVVDEFCDRARSATTDDRPEFLNMIAASKNGQFDIVLVHKLDRFSRNRYDSAFYKRELRRNNVSLMSVLENLDDSPESIILEPVLEGMSEYYSKNLAREVMKGMLETARQCKYTGGHVPFGFKVNKETNLYEIEEIEAEAVRLIFQSVCNGIGYSEIIDRLNALGYRTKAGKVFGKNSIHEILRNEKYRGVYIFNRAAPKNVMGMRNNHLSKSEDEMIRIEGGMPRIVDDETFFKVSKIIKNRSHRYANRSAKESYLLTGKIVCGYCGGPFTGNCQHTGRNKRKLVTYKCSNKSKRGESHCSVKDINRNYLEEFVIKQISSIIFSEDRIPQILSEYREALAELNNGSDTLIKNLKRSLSEVQTKIDNIISVIAKSGSPSLLTTLDSLEAEKAQLEEKIQAEEQSASYREIDEQEVVRAYRKAQKMFEEGTLPQRKQLVNLYVNKVIVHSEYVRIELNDIPSNMKKDTGCTEADAPCDVHRELIANFITKKKKIRSFVTADMRFSGGGDGS